MQKNDLYIANLVHDEFVGLLSSADSSGVQKLFLQDRADQDMFDFTELQKWKDSSNYSADSLMKKERLRFFVIS